MRKRIRYAILTGIMILVICALGHAAAVPEIKERLFGGGQVTNLADKWTETEADGMDAYAYRIPRSASKEQMLLIRNFWSDYQVRLDGEVIAVSEDPYRERGNSIQWLRLGADAAGKTVTICSKSGGDAFLQTVQGTIYLGERDMVVLQFVKDNLFALILGAALMLAGILILFAGAVMRGKKVIPGFCLIGSMGMFLLAAGIWTITDAQILQLYTGKASVIQAVSFLAFMLMPLFFIVYIQEVLTEPKKLLDILSVGYVLNIVVGAISYCFRIFPLYITLPFEHVLIFLTLGCVLWYGVGEVRAHGSREVKVILTGCSLLAGSVVAAQILFYMDLGFNYSLVYSAGILLFVLCMLEAVIEHMMKCSRRSASIEVYRELAYRDQMTGMGNRAAFKLKEAELEHRNLTYIVFDINNLKYVNDTFGHQEGDKLLVDSANCIRQVFESLGECFRIGGDEFVVLMHNADKEETKEALKRLDEQIAQGNTRREIPLEIAYGYSVPGTGDESGKELFYRADAYMYRKKREMKQ